MVIIDLLIIPQQASLLVGVIASCRLLCGSHHEGKISPGKLNEGQVFFSWHYPAASWQSQLRGRWRGGSARTSTIHNGTASVHVNGRTTCATTWGLAARHGLCSRGISHENHHAKAPTVGLQHIWYSITVKVNTCQCEQV